MTIDITRPIQTKGGRKAKYLSSYALVEGQPFDRMAVLVDAGYAAPILRSYTLDGLIPDIVRPSQADLINVAEVVAAFDPDKPVQTRDGRPARIVARYNDSTRGMISALARRSNNNSEYPVQTFADGCFFPTTSPTHGKYHDDIVNVPVKLAFSEQPETQVAVDLLGNALTHEQLLAVSSAISHSTRSSSSAHSYSDDQVTARSEVYWMVSRLLRTRDDPLVWNA